MTGPNEEVYVDCGGMVHRLSRRRLAPQRWLGARDQSVQVGQPAEADSAYSASEAGIGSRSRSDYLEIAPGDVSRSIWL